MSLIPALIMGAGFVLAQQGIVLVEHLAMKILHKIWTPNSKPLHSDHITPVTEMNSLPMSQKQAEAEKLYEQLSPDDKKLLDKMIKETAQN